MGVIEVTSEDGFGKASAEGLPRKCVFFWAAWHEPSKPGGQMDQVTISRVRVRVSSFLSPVAQKISKVAVSLTDRTQFQLTVLKLFVRQLIDEVVSFLSPQMGLKCKGQTGKSSITTTASSRALPGTTNRLYVDSLFVNIWQGWSYAAGDFVAEDTSCAGILVQEDFRTLGSWLGLGLGFEFCTAVIHRFKTIWRRAPWNDIGRAGG